MRLTQRTLLENLTQASPCLLLSSSVLLAWFSSIRSYLPIADDYYLISVYSNGLPSYFVRFGIWRIIGHSIPWFSAISNPYFHSLLAVSLHLCVVLAFFAIYEELLADVRLSLPLALVLGIYPWGFEAVLGGSSLQVVLATLLFSLSILVLLKVGSKKNRQGIAFAGSLILALLSTLTNDYLIFAVLLSGVIVWLAQAGPNRNWRRTVLDYYSGWAPALGGMVYLFLYFLFSRKALALYKAPVFNPESFLSTYYYQYSNIDIFRPWFSRTTRDLLFFRWNWQKTSFAFLAAGAMAVSIALLRRKYLPASKPLYKGKSKLGYALLLLSGASFVYVVGGGYSLDSNKKYPLVPLMLLLFGLLWRSISRRGLRTGPIASTALALLVLCGITTAWLITGIWRFEEARSQALVQYLRTNNTTGNINLVSDIDVYNAWPTMKRTIGFRFDDEWVVTLALRDQHTWQPGEPHPPHPIHMTEESSAATLLFKSDCFCWRLRSDSNQ